MLWKAKESGLERKLVAKGWWKVVLISNEEPELRDEGRMMVTCVT